MVIVALVSVASQAMGQNLLVNGNFATGDYTGWSPSGNYFAVVASSYGINPPQVGDEMVQADGNDAISQTFATTIGISYDLAFASANSRGPNNQGGVYIQGSINGVNLFTDTIDLSNSSWVDSSYEFTADSISTTLQLKLNYFNANGDGLLTDVVVTPVATPEPSALAFGALGLGGLAAIRRSSRKKS